MKNLFLYIFLVFLINTNTQAGELIFGWNLVNPSGRIYDMQFMPDNDYFVLCTATDLQIRSSETGELAQTYPFGGLRFEFTPDSSRIILTPTGGETGRLQLRNIIDLSLIKEYVIPPDSEGFNVYFSEIKVDPIRPFVYVIKRRTKLLDKYYHYAKIEIYNYETMEFIGKLTSEEDEDFYLQYLSVSIDGKYLAEIDASYLRVWDLETRKKIRHFKLATYYPNGPSGSATCLKFSEINTDDIYFSGSFPQSNSTFVSHRGLFKYNIQENKIIDSTFGVGVNRVFEGYFNFFDDNKRIMYAGNGKNVVLNLYPTYIEFSRNIEFDCAGAWSKILYSKPNKYLLGFADKYYSMGVYDSKAGVIKTSEVIKTLYPNPTNGIITLNIECNNLNCSFLVNTLNGLEIQSLQQIPANQTSLSVDFSKYPSGIYLIRFNCGKDIKTYKVIKEG